MTASFTIQHSTETGRFGDPLFVDDYRDNVVETAQEWVLHLRASDAADLIDLRDMVRKHENAGLGIKDMAGGDKWTEWCEQAFDEDPLALHVYFSAPDPEQAGRLAAVIAMVLHVAESDACLTTAGDWAEAAPIGAAA